MTFLSPIELERSEEIDLSPRSAPAAETPDFSPLEWSIIRLAQVDRLWTVRPIGRVRRLWNALTGRGNPELANPRLETLRRMAVLSWHHGFTVSGDDVADFLSAGFSTDQYELMVGSIRAALTSPRRIAA